MGPNPSGQKLGQGGVGGGRVGGVHGAGARLQCEVQQRELLYA